MNYDKEKWDQFDKDMAAMSERLKAETANLPEPPSIETSNTSYGPAPQLSNKVESVPVIEAPATSSTSNNTITVPEFAAKKTDTKQRSITYISKTILPKLADVNYTTTIDTLKAVSNYLNVIQGIENEVKISLNYYNALQSCDVVGSLKEFYNNLNSNSLPVLRNDFVDFWVKRYQLTAEPLKNLLGQDKNSKNSFFTELSDSIGILVNSNSLLDDSTIPFTDYTTGMYTPPNTIPVQLRNKISKTTLEVSVDLSKNNTILMRNNLKKTNLTTQFTNPYTNPTTNPAHGLNLITDINTYNIVRNNLNTYFSKLESSYKNIFSYIQYICNINNLNGYNPRDIGENTGTNQQIITNLLFSFDVENFKVSMDLLQRKFKYLLSYKTNKNTLSNQTTLNG